MTLAALESIEMFDCPNQPGHARVTPAGCGRMYLAAQGHPLVLQGRRFGHKTVPPGLQGTPLGECFPCEIGKTNSQKEMREVQTTAKEEHAPTGARNPELAHGPQRIAKAPAQEAGPHDGHDAQPLANTPSPGADPENGHGAQGPGSSRRARMTEARLEARRAHDREQHVIRTHRAKARYQAQDGFKRCKSCEQVKPVSEYRAHAICLDGLRVECEPCRKEKVLEKREAARDVGQNAPSLGLPNTPAPLAGEAFFIHFDERDLPLLARLEELARQERRNPEQQILRILDLHLGEYPNEK